MTSLSGLLLAGYAMAPSDPEDEAEFFAGVAELGVGGLEYALPVEGTPSLEPSWVTRNVRPDWDLLVTLVPTLMARLGKEPGYGLGSTDEGCRAKALADIGRARDLAVRLADEHGRRRVVAIEVHSAPGPRGGSREAFAKSLDEILTWDLAGAELLVEHCDAYLPGQSVAKGFWKLEDELAAVQAVGVAPEVLGMSVNWGRSVIEGRDIALAVEHTKAVAEAGLLRALVFSGASGAETAWAPAWADTHIWPRGDDPALALASDSLLGPAEMLDTLRVAGDVPRVGLKIAMRPADASVATRLAVAKAALTEIAVAQASL
ncbi:DUF4862 family protein [Pengzhenrongella sicca]|uniref:DUF4862 family protein n=1 Tax=Pengzhenrongella sicca TaxID=2819238 RepID=A0A8A4ZCQ5_9MICO|nr:DUF4862 family protein [Pengzhenrongella sicca]QTE29201.1 DUF4862 family protein [Pengzhenrongella sicca]